MAREVAFLLKMEGGGESEEEAGGGTGAARMSGGKVGEG